MSRRPHRRVVVTAVGLVSPAGESFDEFADAIVSGKSAASPIRNFDATLFPTHFAAQVSPEEMGRARGDVDAGPAVRVDDMKSAWGVLAAKRALAAAGWKSSPPYPGDRVAVVLGTGLSSLVRGEMEEDILPWLGDDGALDLPALGAAITKAGGHYSPARHLTDGVNRVISRVAGVTGRSLSHFGACAASTQAIGDGFRMIRDGAAEAALVGGMDSMVHPFGMISFFLLGALSSRNADMKNACRPFQKGRDGFLMGEGAAMRAALADAQLAPDAVGYVNAHGTGTELNDPAEARAVRDVFGAHAAKLPISSVKPVIGHTIAAAGAFEFAACLAAIQRKRIPPTSSLHRLEDVDPECGGLDHVTAGGRAGSPEFLMTNNYGFGGQNASLILKRI